MAHPQQLKFVEITSKFFNFNNDANLKVIEIGSYILNGSVRSFFSSNQYVGVDLMSGPGVDVVSNGQEINVPDQNFDVAISCECFEHNPYWFVSFQNMYNKLKMGGLLIVSCASRGRVEHGTKRTSPESSPGTQSIEWNYYKNLTNKDFLTKFDLDEMFDSHIFVYNGTSNDLYFVGLKLGAVTELSLSNLKSELQKINSLLPQTTTQKIYNIIRSVIRVPLFIASFLPDAAYQNFAVPYFKFFKRMKSLLF